MSENKRKVDIFDKLSWIFTTLAVIGSLANIQKLWWCFVIWTICNVYFIIHNIIRREKALAVLFFIYLIISVWGMINWLSTV